LATKIIALLVNFFRAAASFFYGPAILHPPLRTVKNEMSEQDPAADLFDLKMLPAWATESPNENRYADFAGEEASVHDRPHRDRGERRDRGPRPAGRKPPQQRRGPREQTRAREPRPPARATSTEEKFAPLPKVKVRFKPEARALENVLRQIKEGHVAYSVFFLARMFLEKPERYDVQLQGESGPLFQLGENGAVASDRRRLEQDAFADEKENFYRVEVVQSEPIKGNFASVARDRLSGTLLGPTNHHAYQQKLRTLYEQRFSRRMSFSDYQRQIEIVNDPEIVERWKEDARNVVTFTTLKEEPPLTFQNVAEAERHFRQNYLPGLVRESSEVKLDGVASRRLADRALGGAIEAVWSQEIRAPMKMMQELIAAFPANGLHLFRHRKSMLFVASVRPRGFGLGAGSVSPSLAAILRAIRETSGINRKQLLEKLLPTKEGNGVAEEPSKERLALASDVHWLIREGYVIEFNDGTLDLVRSKTPSPSPKTGAQSRPENLPNESAKIEPDQPAIQTPNESAVVAESAPADPVSPLPPTDLPPQSGGD
jgi:hypothetical protein